MEPYVEFEDCACGHNEAEHDSYGCKMCRCLEFVAG